MVQQTLDGAVGSLVARAPALARAADEQAEAVDQLRAEVDRSYAEAVRTVGVQTEDGTLLRGEVLARWHDFVGTGEFFRSLESKVGWLRDRVVAAIKGEPAGARDLKVAVESGLESLLVQEADAAAERAESSWQSTAAGRDVLGRTPADLSHSSPGLRRSAEQMIRDWQGAVLNLVADEGMTKRSRARFLAFGVNGVGVALMILVFAHTGGLVGAEVGVAGGTAILAQRVLEAVFGDQAVRRLAETAKAELDARVQALMAEELLRYHALLDGLGVDAGLGPAVRETAAAVDAARAVLPTGASANALRGSDEVPALTAGPRPRPRSRRTARTVPGRGRRGRRRARRARPHPRAALMAGSLVTRGRDLLHRRDPTTALTDRVRALREAAEACEGRVSTEVVDEAYRVGLQVDRRLALSGGATVVALAGATGSGKSSTFNALTGTDLATVGVRRPTTSVSMAATWGEDAGEELLDWLQVRRRHVVGASAAGGPELDGLVLLDLPDHDSTAAEHRTEVDRLVALVDVLVWVVDPQKYADAALHERYLRPLAGHAAVMLVVLNQVDTLTPDARAACLRDLRRLLDAEGLGGVEVLGVSAATGEGLDALLARLGRVVAGKRAAAARLAADVGAAAAKAGVGLGHRAGARARPAHGADARRPAGRGRGRAGGDAGRRPGVAAARRPGHRVAGARLGRQVQARPAAPPAARQRTGPQGDRLADADLPDLAPGPAPGCSRPASTPRCARWPTRRRPGYDAAGPTPSGRPRAAPATACPTRSTGPSRRPTSTSTGTAAGGAPYGCCSGSSSPASWSAWAGSVPRSCWPTSGSRRCPTSSGWASRRRPCWWSAASSPASLVAALARIGVVIGARRRARLARQRLLAAVTRVSQEQVLAPVRAELQRYETARAAIARARG